MATASGCWVSIRAEHPVALQLGGSEPEELARAAEVGVAFGYDEINLNCGCPSDRVQSGRFGACLMAEPALVAACVAAMRSAVGGSVPVTVKCRIGIDDQDSEADLSRFVEAVAGAGCGIFIVHARKAWLQGLSPKENRDVPPLDYERVYRLKAAFPELTIVINGGIATLEEAAGHLEAVDGVMLGRAAYKTPALLLDVDRVLFGEAGTPPSAEAVLERMLDYAAAELARGTRLSAIARHMIGLVNGKPGARQFRRLLTEESVKPGRAWKFCAPPSPPRAKLRSGHSYGWTEKNRLSPAYRYSTGPAPSPWNKDGSSTVEELLASPLFA